MSKKSSCLIAALLLAIAVPVSRLSAEEPASTPDADKELLRSLLNAPADAPAAPPAGPEAPATAPAESPAAPAAPVVPAVELTPAEQQFWNMHWHNAAVYYAAVDGDYYLCAKWDPRYPSSFTTGTNPPHRVTPTQWQIENTTTTTESFGGGLTREKKLTPPAEEATSAVLTIPALAPNEYGYISSAKIVAVNSPTEMIVEDIQLIDADKLNREIKEIEQRGQRLIAAQNERERIERQRERERSQYSNSTDRDRYDSTDNNSLSASDVRQAIEARYSQRLEIVKRQSKYSRVQLRLIGYPTAAAAVGSRWSGYDPRGVQIAIVDDTASKADNKRRSRTVQLTAVNADMLRKGITEQQFAELLAARGMSRRDFVNLVREQLKSHTESIRDTQPYILAALEQARADYEKQKADAADGGEGDAASGRGDFFKQKYGDQPAAGKDAAENKSEKSGKSFFDQKYGDKKSDTDKPAAESKLKDARSFFEKKYSDKSKDSDQPAEGGKKDAE